MADGNEMPNTVKEMLGRMDGIDLDHMHNVGQGFGAMYRGALEQSGNERAALGMTVTWITAAVETHGPDNSEE